MKERKAKKFLPEWLRNGNLVREGMLWAGEILHVLLKSHFLRDWGRNSDIEFHFPLHLYTKNKPCLSRSVSSWWFRSSQDDNSYWSELSESSLIITACSTWPGALARRRHSIGSQIPFELRSCIWNLCFLERCSSYSQIQSGGYWY